MSKPSKPSTKDLDKLAKEQKKAEKEHQARVKAHHRGLFKKGSGARWP